MANFNASWGDAFDCTGDTGNDEQQQQHDFNGADRISNFCAMHNNDFTSDDPAHSDSDIEISGFDDSWGEIAVGAQSSTSRPQRATITTADGSRRRPGRPKGTMGSSSWRECATLCRFVLYTI